jgi:hypothetical protein
MKNWTQNEGTYNLGSIDLIWLNWGLVYPSEKKGSRLDTYESYHTYAITSLKYYAEHYSAIQTLEPL